MKQKVSKRFVSMLLAVVMIIGFVPTFNLTVLAGAVEADTLAGKTVITKVELTIEDPKLHNKIRGYDAGWQVAECIVNDSSKPYYYDNFYQISVRQNTISVKNDFLEAGIPAYVYIPIISKTTENGADADYTFDPWHPEEVEIWVNGVKREDAYVKTGYRSDCIDIVVPFEITEYDGPMCTVTFDRGGVGENFTRTAMLGGYLETLPYVKYEGKVFEGWYEYPEAPKEFDFKNTQIHEDMTLYARWRDILPTETITKLDLTLGIPRLHDGMTLVEAYEAFDKVYNYDEEGYYLRYSIIRQSVELNDDDYLTAGATTYVEICVNATPYEENMYLPPYTFDWNNLDDIEIWIDGVRRTDAKVSSYDKAWRLIRIQFPVTVVNETPHYEEVVDSAGYTRYVSDWEGLIDVMSDLNEEAVEQFGKLRVVLTNDLEIDESDLIPEDEIFIRLDVPAGLDVVFDFQNHTISGDLDIRERLASDGSNSSKQRMAVDGGGSEESEEDIKYSLKDFLLFRLGKDATLTFEGEKSGGISLNVIQDIDKTFSAIRIMSDYPRESRNDPYNAKVIVNGGTYSMTSETEGRYASQYRFGEDCLYRGTFIADHVETEINDGFFNLVVGGKDGREASAFATVVSDYRLHLETASYGSVTPYVETGHTIINGGSFTAMTGGYAVHHFDTPYYIIKNKSCDYAIENKAAPENSYYHINYPMIRGGSFSGRLGFTGFTTTESDGNDYLNEKSLSLMLPENYVGGYYDSATGSDRLDLSTLTWKDLHENTHLVVISDTVLKSMTVTPNGGGQPYQVKEGTDVTFMVNYEWADWLGGSFPVAQTWTVDPTDPGYETYTKSGSSLKLSFAEKQHLSGVTLQARALINTGYGQLVKTVELPVAVHRKVNIYTYTPNLTYDGPEYVMDGDGFYFYIKEKTCYEMNPYTLVVEVDGKEVKPVGDGRYIVNNVEWKAGSNIQINATAETRAYSLIKYVFGTGVIDTAKVYKGESLTLPTLKSLGIELPRNMKMDHWSVSGYGKYQPGDTIEITNAKEITVTVVLESYYAVQMQDGALAYSDEDHTKLISNAKENDYIYIVAPEVEGKQFYMWDYELTSDTYRRPYFGDVTSPETDVMMPDSGIILTPLYTTAVTEVNIYGVIQPVAGEKFISVYDNFGNRSDGIRESDELAFGYSNWYQIVDGEKVSITYSEDVIFVAGETYRYEVNLNVPMSNEGIYDFPVDINDFHVNIEGIPASAYTLTKEFTNQWRDYLKVILEFTIPDSAGVTLSGTITSFGDDTDEIMIELIPEGLTETAYYVIVTGNTAKYNLLNVAAGTYVMKVSKNNHVTRQYTVHAGNTTVIQDVKIHLKGDINGDGRISVSDVGLANAHAKRVSTLEGYQFECANVNGDARITISDVGLMNAHAKKKSLLW